MLVLSRLSERVVEGCDGEELSPRKSVMVTTVKETDTLNRPD